MTREQMHAIKAPPYTDQETLDILYRHLVQDQVYAFSRETAGCLYRDGEKCCAAGLFMRDEDYSPYMEGIDIEVIIETFNVQLETTVKEPMLSEMQNIHDSNGPDEKNFFEWRETGLLNLAAEYELLPPNRASNPFLK